MATLTWTTGYTAAELEKAQTLFRLTFPSDLVDLLLDRRPVEGTRSSSAQGGERKVALQTLVSGARLVG